MKPCTLFIFMTLVRTGSINLSTVGQIFPRAIFSLKSLLLRLNILFDSSLIWPHLSNHPVLPGCFRAINLLLPCFGRSRIDQQRLHLKESLKALPIRSYGKFM